MPQGAPLNLVSGSAYSRPGVATTITLGAGSTTLNSIGQDTIVGGSGPSVIVLNDVYPSTVVAGTGRLAITGGHADNTVFAGPGDLTYTGGIGYGTVVGNGHAITITGGRGGGTYFGGGNGTITAGAGAQTILVGAHRGPPRLQRPLAGDLFGALGANITMDGSASTGDDVFFGAAGTGTTTFIAGSGNAILGLGQGTNLVTLGAGTTPSSATPAPPPPPHHRRHRLGGHRLRGASATLVIQAAAMARTLTLFSYATGADRISLQGFAPHHRGRPRQPGQHQRLHHSVPARQHHHRPRRRRPRRFRPLRLTAATPGYNRAILHRP